MTEDELFEKLRENLQAEIKAAAEKAKAVPTSLRFRPGSTLQQVGAQAATAAFRRVKNGRWYALDNEGKLELAALAIASQKSRTNLTQAIEVIASVIPGWLQDRPADDAGTIPPWPTDPNGEKIRNPWLPLPPLKPGEKTPHYDHRSQAMIREALPRLAAWMEASAKNQGVSMSMIDELESERIEAEHMRKIQFGEKDWMESKIRPGSEATLTEKNLWTRSITDPWLLQFHRREAALGSPRCKFDNLTVRMALAKRDPQVREIHRQAGVLLKQWEQERQEKAAA
jgi:hypothetical protein